MLSGRIGSRRRGPLVEVFSSSWLGRRGGRHDFRSYDCRSATGWRSRKLAIAGSLVLMSEPSSRLLGRFRAREPKPVTERDWERSALLVPRSVPRRPELVSDGAGLPFSLAAFEEPPAPLDRENGAVAALIVHLDGLVAARRVSPVGSRDSDAPASMLDGWRLVASTDGEALFALGIPPRLRTVAVRREGRRQAWSCFASSASPPLRAARGTIRASEWRLDPTREVDPEDKVLRVLLTEQAFASGQRAHGRVLAPDIFVDERELVLTFFVAPRPGYQSATRNPATPVRVALPHAIGARRLRDGALIQEP
jgi:hypothetical protein